MIEMLGVLAVIGVLSAGGIMGYTSAMETYRVNQTIDDIQSMLSSARNVFMNTKGYASGKIIAPLKIKQLGIIPAKYKFADSSCGYGYYCRLKSLFDTPATFYMHASYSRGYLFIVEFFSLPESVCIKMVTKNWMKHGAEFTRITNQAGQMYSNGKGSSSYIIVDFPLTVEKAKLACKGEATLYREIRIDPKDKD